MVVGRVLDKSRVLQKLQGFGDGFPRDADHGTECFMSKLFFELVIIPRFESIANRMANKLIDHADFGSGEC